MSKTDFTITELITDHGFSKTTLYRLIDEGLPYNITGTRTKLINISTLNAFVEARRLGVTHLIFGNTYTNDQLAKTFKCAPQGGMRRSHTTNALVLISDQRTSKEHPYCDSWIDDVLYYTGMGLDGDQSLDFAQNATLRDSNETNIQIYLFEVFAPNQYTYRGQVELISKDEIKSETENNRLVYKFPLKLKVNNLLAASLIIEAQESGEKVAKKLSIDELRDKMKNKEQTRTHRQACRNTQILIYDRDPYLSELVKRLANGKCQLCKENAPFLTKNNDPFLESHHVDWLSQGGTDTLTNCVALCPNCHRKMHIVADPKDVKTLKQIALKYLNN